MRHLRSRLSPPRVVAHVDLARYAGTWYEIAAFPQRFERGCTYTTATYELRPDGAVKVVNRCRRDGRESRVVGKAHVVDPKTNAKLSVSFFWPFRGAYWIVELDPEYRWAAVGNPARSACWILARTPVLDEETYHEILRRLEAQGFETGRLVKTLQEGSG